MSEEKVLEGEYIPAAEAEAQEKKASKASCRPNVETFVKTATVKDNGQAKPHTFVFHMPVNPTSGGAASFDPKSVFFNLNNRKP